MVEGRAAAEAARRGGRAARGAADRARARAGGAQRPAAAPQDRGHRRRGRVDRQHESRRPALFQAGLGRRRMGRRNGTHRGLGGRAARRHHARGLGPRDRRIGVRPDPRRGIASREAPRLGGRAGDPVGAGPDPRRAAADDPRADQRRGRRAGADDAVLRSGRCRGPRAARRGRAGCSRDSGRSGKSGLPSDAFREPLLLRRTRRCGRGDPPVSRRPAAHQVDHRRSRDVDVRDRQPRHAQPVAQLRGVAFRLRSGVRRGAARAAAGVYRGHCPARPGAVAGRGFRERFFENALRLASPLL